MMELFHGLLHVYANTVQLKRYSVPIKKKPMLQDLRMLLSALS